MSERSWKESIALILVVFIAGLMIAGTHSQERTVQLTATTGSQTVQVSAEPSTHNLIVTTFPTNLLHQGEAFYMVGGFTLDKDEFLETLIETPSGPKHVHMTGTLRMKFETKVELFEGSTKTRGMVAPLFNRHRECIKTPNVVVSRMPGGTGDGSLIWSQHSTVGPLTTGDIQWAQGFVLKANTKYLLRTTSYENDNLLATELNWFEHAPKTVIPEVP